MDATAFVKTQPFDGKQYCSPYCLMKKPQEMDEAKRRELAEVVPGRSDI